MRSAAIASRTESLSSRALVRSRCPPLSLLLRLSDLALVLAISPQLRRDAVYSSLSPFGLRLRLSLASYPSVPSPVPLTELEGARLRSPPRRKIIHPSEIVQTLCSERLTPVVSCGGWQYHWQQHSQPPRTTFDNQPTYLSLHLPGVPNASPVRKVSSLQLLAHFPQQVLDEE